MIETRIAMIQMAAHSKFTCMNDMNDKLKISHKSHLKWNIFLLACHKN